MSNGLMWFKKKKKSFKPVQYAAQTRHSFLSEAAGVAWERIKALHDYCPHYHYAGFSHYEGKEEEEGEKWVRVGQEKPQKVLHSLFQACLVAFFFNPGSPPEPAQPLHGLAQLSLPQSPLGHFLFAGPFSQRNPILL